MQHLQKKVDVRNPTGALIVALQMNLVRLRTRVGNYTSEYTINSLTKWFRNVLDGKAWSVGLNEKKMRNAKLFLRNME